MQLYSRKDIRWLFGLCFYVIKMVRAHDIAYLETRDNGDKLSDLHQNDQVARKIFHFHFVIISLCVAVWRKLAWVQDKLRVPTWLPAVS